MARCRKQLAQPIRVSLSRKSEKNKTIGRDRRNEKPQKRRQKNPNGGRVWKEELQMLPVESWRTMS